MLPDVYPIFHPFLLGKSRELCAEWSSIPHTFGRTQGSMRHISLINLRLEPRASSQHTELMQQTRWSGERYTRREWYTQGGIVGIYPGWYTSPYTPGGIYQGVPLPIHRVVYTRVYLSYSVHTQGVPLIPPYITRVYLRATYPPWCTYGVTYPPWCTSQCVIPRVYLSVCHTQGVPPGVHERGVPPGVHERGVPPGVGRRLFIMRRVLSALFGRMYTMRRVLSALFGRMVHNEARSMVILPC